MITTTKNLFGWYINKNRSFSKSVTQKMSYRKEVICFTGYCGIVGALSVLAVLCLLTPQVNGAIGVFQAEVDPQRQGCTLQNEFFMFGISPTQGFCGQIDCDENCHCFVYR